MTISSMSASRPANDPSRSIAPMLGSHGGTGNAPYLPFAGGSYRLTMGLMPLAEPDWLEIDALLAAHLAEKRALLIARPDEVFAALPEAEAASRELLALLAAHLPLHHPQIFARDGAVLTNRVTGEAWDVERPALHPLDLCGRLVQEDFCLLRRDGAQHILVGASLCAPARWRLADKIGHPLAQIHAPVAGYDATLARPVDRLFDQLRPGRLVWRLNWGILDNPARFQPVQPPADTPITAAPRASACGSGSSARPCASSPRARRWCSPSAPMSRGSIAPSRRGPAAADLASAIRALPQEMLRYKQIEPFATEVLAWLEAAPRA